jgi:histidyl-tRNA synthetase
VLRAIDKLDRLGVEGVRALLGPGRKDESGDFTPGAGLAPGQLDRILQFVSESPEIGDEDGLARWWNRIAPEQAYDSIGSVGVRELQSIIRQTGQLEYKRIQFDSGIVRGLDYYTGAVFEAQLTFPVRNEEGDLIVFGSVAGGGRYDDLVARFTGERVPATGISIGVSRLLNALKQRRATTLPALVVVLALDKDDRAANFALASELRAAGIRAEVYAGDGGMKAQLRYADRRNAAIAVIEGADERARGEVTLKDLALGAELAKSVESRAAWVKDRPAQISVPRTDLVARLRELLGRKK